MPDNQNSNNSPVGPTAKIGLVDQSRLRKLITDVRQRAIEVGLSEDRVDAIFDGNEEITEAIKQTVDEARAIHNEKKEKRRKAKEELSYIETAEKEFQNKDNYDELSDHAKALLKQTDAERQEKIAELNSALEEDKNRLSQLKQKIEEDRQQAYKEAERIKKEKMEEADEDTERRRQKLKKLQERVKEHERRLAELEPEKTSLEYIKDELASRRQELEDILDKEIPDDPFEDIDLNNIDQLLEKEETKPEDPFAGKRELVAGWDKAQDLDKIRDQLNPDDDFEAMVLAIEEEFLEEDGWELKYDPETRQLSAKKGDLFEIYRPNQFYMQGNPNKWGRKANTYDRFARAAASLGWTAAEPVNMAKDQKIADKDNKNLQNLKKHLQKQSGVKTKKRPAGAQDLFYIDDPARMDHIRNFDHIKNKQYGDLPERLRERVEEIEELRRNTKSNSTQSAEATDTPKSRPDSKANDHQDSDSKIDDDQDNNNNDDDPDTTADTGTNPGPDSPDPDDGQPKKSVDNDDGVRAGSQNDGADNAKNGTAAAEDKSNVQKEHTNPNNGQENPQNSPPPVQDEDQGDEDDHDNNEKDEVKKIQEGLTVLADKTAKAKNTNPEGSDVPPVNSPSDKEKETNSGIPQDIEDAVAKIVENEQDKEGDDPSKDSVDKNVEPNGETRQLNDTFTAGGTPHRADNPPHNGDGSAREPDEPVPAEKSGGPFSWLKEKGQGLLDKFATTNDDVSQADNKNVPEADKKSDPQKVSPADNDEQERAYERLNLGENGGSITP
jgi:hypothetical protein